MSDADNLFLHLIDLVEGRLDPQQTAQLHARVAADPRAAVDLAWLEATIGLMRNDAAEGVDAPDYVLNRALRLIRPVVPAARQPDLLQRIRAFLRFDSLHQALAPGMRADATPLRQMLYTADACDIDLRIAPAGDQLRLSGQILGSDESGVVIVQNNQTTVEVPLNDLSEFSLPLIPAGVYTLTVRLNTFELVIEGLDLTR
jgi:anti-sigma factor RsiW